jgi:DNA-binding NarL/FixJ family response regulator
MPDTGPVAATVVLVDDHPSFRRSARRLLTTAGYEVVAEAASGAEAIAATREHDPDVVLLDVLLPDCTGFDVVEQLGPRDGRPIVVLISSRSEAEFAGRLAVSSADAFITKSEFSLRTLGEAIL